MNKEINLSEFKDLKNSDLKKGLEIIISPNMSENGRYGDYLGERGVIHRLKESSWSYDNTKTIDIKMHDGHVFKSVGISTIKGLPEDPEEVRKSLIQQFNRGLEDLKRKRDEYATKVRNKERQIEYIKEEEVTEYKPKDFRKWVIKKTLNNDDLSTDEIEQRLTDLIDL